MLASISQPRRHRVTCRVAALVIIGLSCMLADRPAESRPYEKFYGIVHLVPHNLIGTWLIGSRTIHSDQFTEFFAFGGSLAIGSCVGVIAQSERAMKIDAAPMERCSAPARPEGLLGTSHDDAGASRL
jgi:hypothetical protein